MKFIDYIKTMFTLTLPLHLQNKVKRSDTSSVTVLTVVSNGLKKTEPASLTFSWPRLKQMRSFTFEKNMY